MMEELLNVVRREAQHAVGGRQSKSTLVVTGYNPKTHAVKGLLMPSEVETGWIPIAVQQAGDGFGVMSGPNVGSAEKLDGDVFDVEFENGDPNTPIAKNKHFSASDNPPEVKSGETLIKHQTGGSTHFKADGSIVTTHKDGGTHAFDKDGNHTVDTKDKNITVTSGKGSQTFSAKSQSFSADTVSIKGKVSVDGDIAQKGSLSSSGTLAGASGVTSNNLAVRTV